MKRNGRIFFALLILLAAAQVSAQTDFRYYSFTGAALTPLASEVDDLDALRGLGAAFLYAPEWGAPWVGRISGEYVRENQETVSHRIGTAYAEVLYGPRFILDRSFRWYAGPGVGMMHERLKIAGDSYRSTSPALSGSVGFQFEWIDVMVRGMVTVGSENVSAAGVLAVGLALGPF